jgi:hypothetical protein
LDLAPDFDEFCALLIAHFERSAASVVRMVGATQG